MFTPDTILFLQENRFRNDRQWFASHKADYERLVLKQVLLRGSKGHNFDEFKTVINAMASGRISVKKYISRRIKLEEVQAGFEAMKAARGLDTKVIIETQ